MCVWWEEGEVGLEVSSFAHETGPDCCAAWAGLLSALACVRLEDAERNSKD